VESKAWSSVFASASGLAAGADSGELPECADPKVISGGSGFSEPCSPEVVGEAAAAHGGEVVLRGRILKVPTRVEYVGFVEFETGREARLREQRGQQLDSRELDSRASRPGRRGDRGAARGKHHSGGDDARSYHPD